MAISINDFRMAIRLDNSEAKTKLAETKEQIAAVRAEMDKLASEGKKNSDEYKALEKRQDELNKSLVEYRKEGVKTALSYAELRKGASQLKRAMDRATPGTDKWKALRQDYLLTKRRMKELEVQARDTRFSLSKVADGFNRYAAIGAGAVASLTGVVLTARKCVDEYAEMQEAESQVIKYTGMTKEEVADLNEEFKSMDTRTAREKLNALAGDAGRLGITGKKKVLEFVDAADKINVALGEDLGEDAVKNIGKLAQMFGEDEKLGLRGAMLATGSAINEVAQNSSATESYLVGFTARVAGAANQAKVAQGDIIGYASVLDQNMQQQEMAATAFQTLMMKMFQNPAKFAKLAGQNVAEFSSLIRNDANEAMLQFLDTLNKKGGLDRLAPMFKEMGLDGVRASGVISTMAGKVNDIRKAQKLANDAYRDGTSIINEFNVQNNTVQAQLDKAKKKFKDVRVELGEKLQPVMKYIITTGSLTVKGLSALVSVLFEYKGAILSASVAVAAYKIAVNGATLPTKAYTLATKAAAAATVLFNAATKASPWGIIIAGAAGVISYFSIFKDRTNDVTKSIRSMNKEMASEQAQMNTLFEALSRSNKGSQQRKDILNEINEKYGAYLPNLLTEKSSLGEIESAYQRINTKLQEQIVLKFKNQDVSEAMERATEKQLEAVENIRQSIVDKLGNNTIATLAVNDMKQVTNEFYKAGMKWEDAFKQAYHSIKVKYYGNQSMSSFAASDMAAYIKSYYDMQKRIAAINQMYENWMPATKPANQLDEVIITGGNKAGNGGTGDTGGTGNDTDDDDKRPWNTRLQAAEKAYQEELLLLRNKSDSLAQTENEYQLDALQKEQEYQAKRLAIIRHYQSVDEDKKHLTELGKLESEAQTNIYNSLKKTEDTRLNLLKEYRDRRMQTVQEGEKKLQQEQVHLYEMGELQEKDYKNRIAAIDVSSLYSRLDIAKGYQADVADLEFQNGETKVRAMKEAGDAILALEKEISEKRAEIVQSSANQIAAFNNQYSKMNTLATSEQQLSALKDFYTSQLNLAQKFGLDTTLLTATYEAAKDRIEKKGAEERAKVVHKYGLDTAENTKSMRLKALEEEHQKGLLSEEEYQVAKNKIENQYLQEKIEKNEAYFNAVSNIMGNVSSAIQGFQDAEVNKITRKYDKQIAIAKKAGKDTTKLEEEKEEAINQVKKKYADKQFAASVLQVTASTAVAAMEAYKAMAGIPIIGPELGAVAAAVAVASGGAQIAIAKQQRDEAKGLKSGGYSKEYVEGYTKNGNPDDVAGVIPVHKNEFVANHEGVANPHVRQFLDVFDVAQKNGTIRMLNTTQILERIRTHSGKYNGGYTNAGNSTESSFTNENSLSNLTPEQRSQIVRLLIRNNELLEVLTQKEIMIDLRRVRDGIRQIEKLESNISR